MSRKIIGRTVGTTLNPEKLKGQAGGGANGKSAYEIWLEAGNTGTEADFLASLEGADGISPTVSISKSGKVTTITITDKDGTHTATINDGEDGADGYSPVRGTDYWTETDKTEIKSYCQNYIDTELLGGAS